MRPLILAIDQGTTGTTALIFDESFQVLGKVNHEFPQHFPESSWVEHNLNENLEFGCKLCPRCPYSGKN